MTANGGILPLAVRWKTAKLAFSTAYDRLPDGIHRDEVDRLGITLARAEAELMEAVLICAGCSEPLADGDQVISSSSGHYHRSCVCNQCGSSRDATKSERSARVLCAACRLDESLATSLASTPVKISKAEYRRRLVKGLRLECTQHKIERYVGTMRTITKVQTNGVWFLQEGATRRAWSPFDAVAEVRANDSEIIVYFKDEHDGPRMTLRVLGMTEVGDS